MRKSTGNYNFEMEIEIGNVYIMTGAYEPNDQCGMFFS